MRFGRRESLLIALTLVAGSAPFVLRFWPTGETGSVVPWTRTLAEAKNLASAGDRIIITDLYTDWCGWCKEMDRKTWSHPSVAERSSGYVFLKLNAESDPDGIALQKRFGVQSYPTVLLLDSAGEEFARLEGYLPAREFLTKLDATLSDPEALGNLRKQEVREPQNLEVRLKMAKRLFSGRSFREAEIRLEQILSEDPENRSNIADSALFYLALSQASQMQTETSLSTIERLRRAYPGSSYSPTAHLLSGEILLRTGRREEARARLEEFLKSYPEHRLVTQAKKLLSEL